MNINTPVWEHFYSKCFLIHMVVSTNRIRDFGLCKIKASITASPLRS